MILGSLPVAPDLMPEVSNALSRGEEKGPNAMDDHEEENERTQMAVLVAIPCVVVIESMAQHQDASPQPGPWSAIAGV